MAVAIPPAGATPVVVGMATAIAARTAVVLVYYAGTKGERTEQQHGQDAQNELLEHDK